MKGLVLATLVGACGRIDFAERPDAAPLVDAATNADADASAIPGLVVAFPCDLLVGQTAPATLSAYSGTCNPCPTVTAGIHGNAYRFAGGLEEFIQLPAISTSLLGPAPFTISLWLNAGDTNGPRALVSKPFDTMFDRNVASVLINVSGGLLFETTITGAEFEALNMDTPSLEDSQWHHIAARWDGTTKTAFLDGAVLGSNTTPAIMDSTLPLRIGADMDVGATAHPHNGLLDDIQFYSRALTDAEILLLASQ